jgi:phage shock protein C
VADRLYRTGDDKVLAGVAGGIARQYDWDPSLVRIVWVLAAIATGGIAVIVYIVMALVVPYAPVGYAWPAATAPEPWPQGASGTTGTNAASAASAAAATSGTSGGSRHRDHRGRHPTGLVLGLILVAVGVVFLVRELLPAIDIAISWPVIAVVFGIALIVLSIRPRRSAG